MTPILLAPGTKIQNGDYFWDDGAKDWFRYQDTNEASVGFKVPVIRFMPPVEGPVFAFWEAAWDNPYRDQGPPYSLYRGLYGPPDPVQGVSGPMA